MTNRMTTKAGEQPTITQEDINAATALYNLVQSNQDRYQDWEQAFAKHRTTSLAAQDVKCDAKEIAGTAYNEMRLNDDPFWCDVHVRQRAYMLHVARRAFEAGQASLAAQDGLVEALRAQHDAEMARNECEECEGEGDWVECSVCSLAFGNAIDLRHAALSALGDKP